LWIILKLVYVTILISAKGSVDLAQDRFQWWSVVKGKESSIAIKHGMFVPSVATVRVS